MPFKKSHSQCPLGIFWRGETLISRLIGILLGLALIGLIIQMVFWTFTLSFFALKWLLILGLIFFFWQKAKYFYWVIRKKWQNKRNLK